MYGQLFLNFKKNTDRKKQFSRSECCHCISNRLLVIVAMLWYTVDQHPIYELFFLIAYLKI